MRDVLREKLSASPLPLVGAHRGGAAHGRENSIAAIKAVLPFKPDLIEVDVRKSSDGVLYCHHGSVPLGVSAAKFHRFLRFKQIQLFTGKRDTLEEILRVIPADIGVFLDIKDKRVSPEELSPLIRGRNNVWVSAYTIRHLRMLRKGLGEDFLYALNRPLLSVRGELNRVQGVADSVHAFVWQWNASTRAKLEKAGIVCAHVQWFLPKAHKTIPVHPRKGVIWYAYDDLTKTHRTR